MKYAPYCLGCERRLRPVVAGCGHCPNKNCPFVYPTLLGYTPVAVDAIHDDSCVKEFHVKLEHEAPVVIAPIPGRDGLKRGRGLIHHRLPTPESPIALEEAAKLEIQGSQSKTPVSRLQELLSRRGTTPKYELVQVEGAIHEPTFRYRVSVGENLAMGTGRSKKEAKHAAAKAILEKLAGSGENGLPPPNSTVVDILKPINGPDDRPVVGNPIGLLQELCMSRRWPPPAYDTEFEEGLPHERQFTISCVVFRHKETGTGKSKKIAKRLAAYNMWQRLKNLPMENSAGGFEGLDEDDVLGRNYSDSSKPTDWDFLRTAKIPSLPPHISQKVSQFHKNLRSSEGEKLNEIKKAPLNDPTMNHVQMLKEIGAEQSFDVTFVEIEEKSHSGQFQCLVQLCISPIAVLHGSGSSMKDAQSAAALNALYYLKLMIRK